MVYFPPGLFIAAPAFSYQGSGEREMAYADFKSYLQANYRDMLENEITELVKKLMIVAVFIPSVYCPCANKERRIRK